MTIKKSLFASAAIAALLLTGCSSGGGGDDENAGGNENSGAQVDEATERIAPFMDPPTDFPITTPLDESVAGKTVAYLDCGTPICADGWEISVEAAEPLGVELSRIDAGLQAESIASAFDTIIERGFDGVINPALPNALAEAGLNQLKENDIPVVGAAVVNADPALYGALIASEEFLSGVGRNLADHVVATYGDEADVVFYVIPELELTFFKLDAFEAELSELCPDCNFRTADIPVTSIGTQAPTIVVDDLQANPNTTVAVFSTAEAAIGLPAALDVAGIEGVDIIGSAPAGEALRQIQSGEMAAGMAYDFTYLRWSSLDALARLMTGQELDQSQIDDILPKQLLTADDITDEMVQTGSWLSFPTSMFEDLWVQ